MRLDSCRMATSRPAVGRMDVVLTTVVFFSASWP